MVKENTDRHRCLALISGGLDSQLAAKLIAEQGNRVVGVNFRTGFISEDDRELYREIENDLGIEVRMLRVPEEDYLELIKSPKHGYGSAMNPCLDCRILVLREAKKYMEEISADFVITGEVLGQRPMTQRKDTMDLIKRESGLGKRLLRPLSARLLSPTLPEERGWVDRDKLLDIEGRSRKVQLKLAEKLGINHYSQPAGGCLLTEEEFGHRIREVFDHKGKDKTTVSDLKVLKYGRHFRLPDGAKAIIGRDEEENENLEEFLDDYWSIRILGFSGPLTLITRGASESDTVIAARLTGRYSQGRDQETLEAILERNGETKTYRIKPLERDSDLIRELRIEYSS
ncbi:MAG: asparagine synthase-related protein [Candidatus Bipolaricaulota bacterium]